MKTLELKHYLGTGLQMKLDRKVIWHPNKNEKPKTKECDATLTPDLFADIYNGTFDSMAEFIPILHPISDLTKPVLAGGEIPIVELAKIGETQHFDGSYYNITSHENKYFCVFFMICSYNKRTWLNPISSDSTGSVACFDGKVSFGDNLVDSTFIEISDCRNKIRLHQTVDDSRKQFVDKLKLLKTEIELFINHFEKDI